jgi:DNA-directed RNA polymerase specialized sigma24 family protein
LATKKLRTTRKKQSGDTIDNEELFREVVKSKERLKKNPDYPAEAITPRLAQMFVLMVNNYATAGNWSGYSYLEEMKGEALLGLSAKWHKFDETKGDNPFAYYTRIMFTRFVSQLGKEKRPQVVRDAILESRGEDPSLSKQMQNEEGVKESGE